MTRPRMRKPTIRLRRARTRREALMRRIDDLTGHLSWVLTRWYGRQIKSQLPPNTWRWSALAGGAGVTAGVAGLIHRRGRSRGEAAGQATGA
jgi:hypothetical protein